METEDDKLREDAGGGDTVQNVFWSAASSANFKSW